MIQLIIYTPTELLRIYLEWSKSERADNPPRLASINNVYDLSLDNIIKILLSDLTIFAAENRAEMTILWADLISVRKRMILNQFRSCRNDYSRRR